MKMFKRFAAVLTCSALIMGFAPNVFAAEKTTPAVHLNGAYMESADTLKDYDCTYMEANQLFTSLGATEITINEGIVSAVKNDNAVSFSAGNTLYTLNGTEISLKTAPFEENGKLYIPIRPAAEAMECKIGWDNAAQAVIILDPYKLLGDTESGYTIMEKYMAYSTEFANEYPYLKGKMTFTVTADDGEEKLTFKGKCDTVSFTTTEEMIINADFSFSFDEIEDMLVETYKTDPEFENTINTLESFTLDVYMDIKDGKFYISSDLFPLLLGADENTWILVDFNEIFGMAGMASYDFASLSTMAGMESFDEYADSLFSYMSALDNVYMAEATALSLNIIKLMYSDESFIKNGMNYTSTYSLNESGAETVITLTLMDNGNRIYGYDMEMSMNMDGLIYMYMDMETVDEDSVFTMNMNMMDMMEVNMDGTFKYEERITDPLVKPDENSFTVSLTEILF
ncbi:MAG: copper amine oxidase N-terminal domain-containing protein [Firmicutes bacterium]|nr:copper amine oxidase N-terminal domain-containing protein [Bacillota bacterium]